MAEKEYYHNPDTTQISFRANPLLTKQITDLAAERHRSRSNVIRMLIRMGMQEYENNKLSGITTKAKIEEQQSRRRAEAEAIARQRELRRRFGGKNPLKDPAASAMLVDNIPPDS